MTWQFGNSKQGRSEIVSFDVKPKLKEENLFTFNKASEKAVGAV